MDKLSLLTRLNNHEISTVLLNVGESKLGCREMIETIVFLKGSNDLVEHKEYLAPSLAQKMLKAIQDRQRLVRKYAKKENKS